MKNRFLFLTAVILATPHARAEEPTRYLPATAHVIPKWTATDGEGYFAIIEGHNRRLYIGTHANGVNSWLVEFDPVTNKMAIAVDAHKAIGKDLKGFGSQAKIHTRNNVGTSGKVYFGTKQGYPDTKKGEKFTDYPGGYPMAYDPKTGKTEVFPIPVPHHGINSIMPDDDRGLIYVSTCSDERPVESAHFLVYNRKTGKYKDLIDTKHVYGFIVLDHLGRAYHPVLGGDIVRYDPRSDRLERLKQTVDGKSPTADSLLADPKSHPINWDMSPDGKTLYAVAMSGNQLYSYDVTGEGDTLAGHSLGELVPGATKTDCRAMCVGPTGEVWAGVTVPVKGGRDCHLVRYRPGDKAPVDLGVVEVKNPDFTEFTGKDGKALPFHGGFKKNEEGRMLPRYVIMGVCEAKDGHVYLLALHPYTLLQIQPPKN